MQRTADILQDLQSALFVFVGVVAVLQWMRRRGRAEALVAGTFGVLAAVVIAGRLIPPASRSDSADLARAVLVMVLALFPYLAFRFAGTFQPASKPWRVAGVLLTLAAGPGILLAGDLPRPGEPRSARFTVWLVAFIAQWFVLSMFAAIRLWRGGKGLPVVARRRMRIMASALAVLAIILLAAAPQQESAEDQGRPGRVKATPLRLVTLSIGLVSSPMFLLGFAPPAAVVWLWRRRDEDSLRLAEASLVGATSAAEVGETLLPHAARLVGGSAAVLRDKDGALVASFGPWDEVERLKTGGDASAQRIVGEEVSLLVSLGPYAPYFGREELRILRNLVALTDLAIARSTLLEQRTQMVEALRVANDSTREFVAIASHDLRTPLTVIQGLLEVIDENWEHFPDATKREQIAAMRRQAQHLSRLVEDLLTASKIDANAIEPAVQDLDVEQALRQLIADLQRTEEDVTIAVTPGLWVRADPEHLSRMVWNYVQNASIYGQPPIEITASRNDSKIEIRVSDRGEGVPEEFRDRLFMKFSRVNKKASKAANGTGLGLAIVRGLARASGGDAWYEEREDGACFVIALPSVEAEVA